MGINNLLQFLKPITYKSHIEKYKNEIIGVDIMCWIHRSLVSCAFDIVTGKDNDRYLKFIIKMLDLLEHYEVKVVAVFDGDELPAKKLENEMRRNRRNKAKEEVLELVKKVKNPQRNAEVMKKCFQALSVSKEIIHTVINLCKEKNIEYIIAPYEADAQLSYLCRLGYISAAISEDSDLLVYGCPRVLYKMKDDGSCYEIKMIPMNDLITLDKIMQIKNPLSSDHNEIFITPIKNMKKENKTEVITGKENNNHVNRTEENDNNGSKEHSHERLHDLSETTSRRFRRNYTNSHQKKTESNKLKMGQCILREKSVYKIEKKEKVKAEDTKKNISESKEELYQRLMNNYINHFKWPTELSNLKYFDLAMFITMCILSGCDYSNDFHVNGMGIRTAFQLVYEFKNVKKLFTFLTKEDKWKFKLPRQLDSLDKLLQKYKQIECAFTNHPVYDIATGKTIPIQDSFQSVVSKRKGSSVIEEIIQFSNENIQKSLEDMKQQMELIRIQRFEQPIENEKNRNEETDPIKPMGNKLLGNISPGTLEFLEISSSENGEEQIFTPLRTTIYSKEKENNNSKGQVYSQDLTAGKTMINDDKNITNVCYNVDSEKTEPTIINDLTKKEEPTPSGKMNACSPKYDHENLANNGIYYHQTEEKKSQPTQHIENHVPSFYDEEMNLTPLQFSFDTEKFSNFSKINEECSAIKNKSNMHEELKHEKIEIFENQENKEHLNENRKQKIETKSIKDSYQNISKNYSFIKQNCIISSMTPITQIMDKENKSVVLQPIGIYETELGNAESPNLIIKDLKKYNYRNCDINMQNEIKKEVKNELNITIADSKLPIVSLRKSSRKVPQDVQQMKITTFFKKTNINKDDENTSPKLHRIAQTERYSSGGSTPKANSFEKTQEISLQEDKYETDVPNHYDSLDNSSNRKQQHLATLSKRKYEGNDNCHSKKKSIFSNPWTGVMDIRCFGSTSRKETAMTQSGNSIENLLSLSKDKYVKENLSNSYNCIYSKEYEQRNEERNYDGTSPLKKEWKQIIDSVKRKHSLNIDFNTLEECAFYENQLRQTKRKKKEIKETYINSINTNPYHNPVCKESNRLKIEDNITKLNTPKNESLFKNLIQQQKLEKSKDHTTNENNNNINTNINLNINNKPGVQDTLNIDLQNKKEYPKRNFTSKTTKLNPFDYFKELKDPIVKNPYLEK